MSEETDNLIAPGGIAGTEGMGTLENPTLKPEEDNSKADGRSIQVAGAVTSSILVTGNDNQITINAGPADVTSHGTPGEATLNLLSSQIETLSADLSEEKAIHLEELRELFREGAMEEAYEAVLEMHRSPNWVTLSATLRASALRALATMTLSLKGKNGVAEATEFAERAKSTKASSDDITLQVRIAVVSEGHEAALKRLETPINVDTYNLHLGLLLETGRIEDAVQALHNPPSNIVLDAETYRLFALALLAQRDVAGARDHINKALAERPRRQYIRYQAAAIDYFSALSKLALPPYLVPFPRPVNLSMVRGDSSSYDRLTLAAEEFKRIAERGMRSNDERRRIETWHLACIANLSDRQQDAIQLCKDRLTTDPGNAHIVSWVLFRRYDLDLSASRTALEGSLKQNDAKDDPARLEDVLALIGIYLKDDANQDALNLLERESETFAAVDALDLWRYWSGQILVASGQPKIALEDASRIEDQTLRRPLMTAALCEIANDDRDWRPVVAHLEESHAAGDKHSLLILCDLKFQFGEWAYVADRAEPYCDAVGTATAARMVIAATWNAKRPAQCLRLLNQYEPLFGDGRLPFDLRRLRIHCLVDSDIKEALAEAEAVAQEDESMESLMLLMDVRLTKGDLVGLELSARELLNRDDVTAEQYLRVAHLVKLNNPSLAKRLWLRAVENAADSAELTAFAVDIAAKLGLEKYRGSLMQRMMEYAEQGQGPMRAVSMEQTLQMMRETAQQQAQLQQMYAAAEAPIHLVAKGGLAQVLHGLAEWNRSADRRERRHLLVRHGGRTLLPIDYQEVATNWRLHCDISSLLLAYELGVLEKIERQFKPLRISRQTVTALIAQRDKLKPHQKSQVDQSQTLLEMITKGRLRVLDADLPSKWLDELKKVFGNECLQAGAADNTQPDAQNARAAILADPAKLQEQLGTNRLEVFAAALAAEGFAVTFLPLQCYGASKTILLSIPESLKGRLVNCRAIADALRGRDRITEEQYQRALKALGTEGHCHAAVTPLIGARLFISEGMADVLIGAELFERVCSNFQVAISPSSMKEAEGMIEHYDRLAKIEGWLNELTARIREGVDEGTYEFITIPDERIAQRDDREERLNQDFTSTLDLFLFEPQEWDVIWLDDRALNKYALRGDDKRGVPLLGIQEILLALRAQGQLDEHEYYELLLKMRESDFRYLPLATDEILYHLRRARIENARLIETEALASIRRYYSSCMLDKEILQFGTTVEGSPNPHSELPFVIQTINSTADAIARVWQEAESNTEMKIARADWILSSIYTGNFGCSSLRPDTTPPSELFTAPAVIGLDVCNLLMRGIAMHGNPVLGAEISQRRNEYFDWLKNRVVDRRYGSDPEVVKVAAAELQERFGLIKAQTRTSDAEELFARAFAGKFFLDLPEVIAQHIEFDEEMTEWLQLRIGSIASIGGESFHADDYWRAVEQALGSGVAAITSQDSGKEYRLIRLSSGNQKRDTEDEFPKISVLNGHGNHVGEMNDPSLGLLLPDEAARRTTIHRLRGWFDCGREEFEAEASKFVSNADPASRMMHLYEWRTRSTELYYRELEDRLRRQEELSWSQLLPNFESLAGRMRLPVKLQGLSFEVVWEKSAQALLEEDELLAVLARLSSLPVIMPQPILDAVSALELKEKLCLFERISDSWTSPIRLLHVLNLALRCFSDGGGLAIAGKVLTRLYGEKGAEDFNSFKAVLMFVNEEVAELEIIKTWSLEIRLALTWIHACRLHDLMRAVGFSGAELGSQLERRRGALRSALVRDGAAWYDCAHPLRLNQTVLLTHGVASLLAGLDGSLLDTAKVPELIRKEALQQLSDDTLFPKLGLLTDPTLVRNGLCSFLGTDRHPVLSPMIDDEVIEHIASENLKRSVQHDLLQLAEDPSKPLLWTGIDAVTDDLPIYSDLSAECRKAVESFDPYGARPKGFRTSSFVFRAAAFQVTHLQEESLRGKYRDYVLELLKREVAGDNVAGDEDIPLERRVFSLVEIASILSYVPGDAGRSSREFTSMLERMAEIWPEFVKHYGRSLSSEVWDMPVDESEGWWHLTLSLRSVA
jgi:hypothetical protein